MALFLGLIAKAQNTEFAFTIGNIQTSTSTGVVTDQLGNIYFIGEYSGTVDFNLSTSETHNLTANSGDNDLYIAKYDKNQKFVWAKSIGGPGGEYSGNIALDSENNIIFMGTFEGTIDLDASSNTFNVTSKGGDDIFIVKYNTNGDFIFGKTIAGTSELDSDKKITLDSDDNIYIPGKFRGTADFNPDTTNSFNLTASGRNDGFILKLNKSGEFQWAFKIGAAGSYDFVEHLAIDNDNNVYALGAFEGTVDFDPTANTNKLTPVGDKDIFFAKYSSEGKLIWVHQIGNSSDRDYPEAIATDNDNNIVFTGGFRGTIDTDASLNTSNVTAKGSDDVFIAKYNENGKFIWGKSIGGSSYDQVESIATGNSNDVYVTGRYWGSSDFDPSANETIIPSKGSADIFLVKLNKDGNFDYAKGMGGTKSDQPYNVFVDNNEKVFIAGEFSATADFGGLSLTSTTTSSFGDSAVIIKIKGGEPAPTITGVSTLKTCENNSINITNIIANNHNTIEWTSSNNGTFSDNSIINPTYTPNEKDIENGTTILTVKATKGSSVATKNIILVVQKNPNAGLNGELKAIIGIRPNDIDLFNALNGTPDNGGIWSQISTNSFKYTVKATNPCTKEATAIVTIKAKKFIDAFSPNGDNINDTYVILDDILNKLPKNSLKVFNRHGVKVYQAAPYNNNWDGTSNHGMAISKGSKLPAGSYYYVFETGNNNQVYKGWLYINY